MARAILGAVLIAALASTTGAVGTSVPAAAKNNNTGAIVGRPDRRRGDRRRGRRQRQPSVEHLRQPEAAAAAEARPVVERLQPEARRQLLPDAEGLLQRQRRLQRQLDLEGLSEMRSAMTKFRTQRGASRGGCRDHPRPGRRRVRRGRGRRSPHGRSLGRPHRSIRSRSSPTCSSPSSTTSPSRPPSPRSATGTNSTRRSSPTALPTPPFRHPSRRRRART